MNAQIPPKHRGIPNYFKKVGLAVMVLAFLLGVLVKAGTIEMAQHTKDLFKVFTMNGIIVGLLLIALANDKIEDEMISSIRIQSMAGAFIATAVFVIVMPLVDLAFNDPVDTMTGQQVVLTMLLVYLFTYYMQKRRVR